MPYIHSYILENIHVPTRNIKKLGYSFWERWKVKTLAEKKMSACTNTKTCIKHTHTHIHTNPPTHCQMFCFVANTNTYQSFAYLFRKWGHCCMPCNPYQGYFSDTKFPRTHANRQRCIHEHAFTLQTQTLTQSLSLWISVLSRPAVRWNKMLRNWQQNKSCCYYCRTASLCNSAGILSTVELLSLTTLLPAFDSYILIYIASRPSYFFFLAVPTIFFSHSVLNVTNAAAPM